MQRKVFILFTLCWFSDISCPANVITVDDDGIADFNNIQAAINYANNGDTIEVQPGVYRGLGNRNIDTKGKAIVVIGKNGPQDCIIDCENSGQGFYIHSGEDSNTIIENLTIVDGNAPLMTDNIPRGGGIFCKNSSPTIKGCIISNCFAFHTVEMDPYWTRYYGQGGGICCLGFSSGSKSPQIQDCNIFSNLSGNSGGGVYFESCNPTISNSAIHNNITRDYDGIPKGAGIACYQSSANIIDCRIYNNVGEGDSFGGGISCYSSNEVIKRCIISGNSSTRGGGISSDKSSPKIENCLIINNSAVESGGGIACQRDYRTPNITNCTISCNTADDGGAMSLWTTVATITNCIFWDNIPSEITNTITGTVIVTYSDIKGGWSGEGNINSNPLFASYNDYHLVFGSPCIDTGTNTPPGGLPATDLDGIERPIDGDFNDIPVADMGTYEFHRKPGSPILALTPDSFRFSCPAGGPDPEPRTLYIWNGGGGLLNWEIDEVCPWLEVEPDTGNSEGETDSIILRVDANNLESNNYECTLKVFDPFDSNNTRFIDVTLRVGPTILVPQDYNTIQAAIDAAFDGDEIIVANGTYTGQGNRDIDFKGKAITVRSESNDPNLCIIDCQGSPAENHRGFYFHSCEDNRSVLSGFTIKNGYLSEGVLPEGGGIFCLSQHTDPLIENCIIINNKAYSGGGISCYSGSPIIKNCIIAHNNAYYDNSGGILCWDFSNATISGCTIVHNTSKYEGGGIFFYGGSHILKNSIIWGNTPRQIELATNVIYNLSVSYCDIQGGWASGTSILNIDPNFIDADNNNYHVSLNSPCIDMGDPNYSPAPFETDIDGQRRVMNNRVDIGADEISDMLGDFDENGSIDARDLNSISETWLSSEGGQNWEESCDLNNNNSIDFKDYAFFANNYTKTLDTQAPSKPENLIVTDANSSSVSLSWEIATDNVSVVGYKIYRDGNYIGYTGSITFTDSNIEANSIYLYQVSSYDAVYNESDLSNPCQVTIKE